MKRTRSTSLAAQALIAGTASGADLLGLADRVGTLQPGKYADIVVVAGNPLASIDATEHPSS
jgi:imidazolonepropionase-like amidohydrolase